MANENYFCEKIEPIGYESIIQIRIEPCQPRHSTTEIDSIGTKTQSCQTQNQSEDTTQMQSKLQSEPPSNVGSLPIYHFGPIYLPNPSPPCISQYMHHQHPCENYWNICPTPYFHCCDQCCLKACCEPESETKPATKVCEKKNVDESAECKSGSSKKENSVEKESDCEQISKDDTQCSSVTICTSQEENLDVSEHQSKKAHKSKSKNVPKKKQESKVHQKIPQKTPKSEKKFQSEFSCCYELPVKKNKKSIKKCESEKVKCTENKQPRGQKSYKKKMVDSEKKFNHICAKNLSKERKDVKEKKKNIKMVKICF